MRLKYQILAFLEAPSPPNEMRKYDVNLYRENQHYHRIILYHSMSGRRLHTAFGDLWNQIWWDNANPTPGEQEADIVHMDMVYDLVRPEILLTFGRMATEAVPRTSMPIHTRNNPLYWLSCHHPAARGKTQHDLDVFTSRVREWIKAYTRDVCPTS